MPTYYEILGVNPNASAEEITKQYKKLVLELHPDKNPGKPEANDQFVALKKAYDILKDDKDRRDYDNYLAKTQPVSSRQKQQPPEMSFEAGSAHTVRLESLVPVEDLIKEFERFANKKVSQRAALTDAPTGLTSQALANRKAQELHPSGLNLPLNSGFDYHKRPGPPEVHVFIFPDKASMDEFIQLLLSKNMVKFPDGLQNRPAVERPQQQSGAVQNNLRDQLKALKNKPETPEQPDNIQPDGLKH